MEEDNSACHSCHLGFVSCWPRLNNADSWHRSLIQQKSWKKSWSQLCSTVTEYPEERKNHSALPWDTQTLSYLQWPCSIFQWGITTCERQDGFKLELLFILYIHRGLCARNLTEFLEVQTGKGGCRGGLGSRKRRGTTVPRQPLPLSGAVSCQWHHLWQHRDATLPGHSHEVARRARLASKRFPPHAPQPWRKSASNYFCPVKRLNLISVFLRVKQIGHY